MHDTKRFQLRCGPYVTPEFNYGDIVCCEVRGEVTIVRLTDGKIPWPLGKKERATTFVVYADLERAVRTESNQAVCHWWGVTPQTVSKWRKALDVEATTEGTRALRSDHLTKKRKAKLKRGAIAAARRPERVEKIRQSKLGKPSPKNVIDAVRAANLGGTWSKKARRNHKESWKRPIIHGVKNSLVTRKFTARPGFRCSQSSHEA